MKLEEMKQKLVEYEALLEQKRAETHSCAGIIGFLRERVQEEEQSNLRKEKKSDVKA